METPTSVTVMGSPVDVWFAACMLARFAPVQGDQIYVRECASAEQESRLIARPEMARVHASLGLDPRRCGAQAVQFWPAGADRSIPFGPIGAPYKSVGFAALWARARLELGEARDLADFASTQPSGAWSIDTSAYTEALKHIATNVGVRRVDEARGFRVMASPTKDAAPDTASVKVGAAALNVSLPQALHLSVLEKTIRVLIDCWSWCPADVQISAAEFARRIDSIRWSFEDMQALLNDVPYSDMSAILRQRVAVWRETSRIAPFDDDAFRPTEWMAAMVAAGMTPTRSGRLAETVSLEVLKAHIDACACREANHAA